MPKPICKECEREGKKYSVEKPSYGVTTCMGIIPGYWDEDGKYHEPFNPNNTTYSYQYSNGHQWREVV